jgi:hypothetical protein
MSEFLSLKGIRTSGQVSVLHNKSSLLLAGTTITVILTLRILIHSVSCDSSQTSYRLPRTSTKEVREIDINRGHDLDDDLSLVWIVGHVLTGWDGTQSQLSPSNLCKCAHAIAVLGISNINWHGVYQMYVFNSQ